MNRPLIDLRSDTVTRPTPGMRQAMMEAEVGDDVFGDDPTVKRLEARTAERLGKEAAIYVPSGTMANQIAVGIHTRPGDELLCASNSHVYVWEAGGIARLSGVTARTFAGDSGLLSVDDLAEAIRPDDIHYVKTRLVWLENTHNRGGGRIQSLESIDAIRHWAREHRLAMHLDGARLMNAVVATGRPARVGAALRHRLDLLLQRPRSARGLGPGRVGRVHPQGPPASQAFWWWDAAGWDHRGRCTLRPGEPRRPPR